MDGLLYGAGAGAGLGAALTLLIPSYREVVVFVQHVLFGAAVGAAYGLTLGLLAWPLGALLVRSGLLRRKGISLALGVIMIMGVAVAVTWPPGGPDTMWHGGEILYVMMPAVFASLIALAVGVRYDLMAIRQLRRATTSDARLGEPEANGD